jgi:hypothetical protein
MALPRINALPKYKIEIPSTGEQYDYRPFLTKEQKVLLIALETQDEKQILSAITNTIEACVENINMNKLTTFDVEYIFTQIRSKSVGEKSHIGIKCTNCEHTNEVTVNVEEIKIEVPDKKSSMIRLNDEYTLKMKFPNYVHMLNNDRLKNSESATGMLIELIIGCLDSLKSEDENINFKDEPIEEVEAFVDSLTSDQFNAIMDFVNTIPKLKHKVEFVCESCGTENSRELVGINDFFR